MAGIEIFYRLSINLLFVSSYNSDSIKLNDVACVQVMPRDFAKHLTCYLDILTSFEAKLLLAWHDYQNIPCLSNLKNYHVEGPVYSDTDRPNLTPNGVVPSLI